ncbi:hypothetical protein Glove_212g38 [Diversispora epigaea]|uniref:Uncharacterized protein n=1 Tax=Diversispora epigaea TaxID=1348612 RepID=A0A397ISM4_9GLOM|nr:hypothetical protein Glove_212g38 [Diversispora epigaea]
MLYKLYITGVAMWGLVLFLYWIIRFTEEEIQSIVTCYFDNDIETVNDVIDQMRQLYFGYTVKFRIQYPDCQQSRDAKATNVDLFVSENGDGPLVSNVVLELKYIIIAGLLSGEQED